MAKNNGQGKRISRRSVLRQTGAGTAAATSLASLFGTVSAEEPTEEDAEEIRNLNDVRKICSELGAELPEREDIERRHFDDNGSLTNGEMVLRKASIKYGNFLIAETRTGKKVIFNFDPDLDEYPDGYPMAKRHGGTIAVRGSVMVYSRPVSEEEHQKVVSAANIEGEIHGSRIIATSGSNGYIANISVETPNQAEFDTKSLVFEVDDGFDPKKESTPEGDLREVSSALRTQGLKGDLIYDFITGWIIDEIAGATADVIGANCDDSCGDCVSWIMSMALDCRNCGPICTTSASGMGAVACVICVYAFCSDVLEMMSCSECIVCIHDGEEPDEVPDWEDAAALLPSPPSWPF